MKLHIEVLVEPARRYGAIKYRSVPKQIEYWSQSGKITAENPDLCVHKATSSPLRLMMYMSFCTVPLGFLSPSSHLRTADTLVLSREANTAWLTLRSAIGNRVVQLLDGA